MAAGGGAGSGAVRAGQAFVELVMKDVSFTASLTRAKAKFEAFGAQLRQVGLGLAAGGGAVLAPITGLFKAAVDQGADLGRLATQLGETAESVSSLGYAFSQAGLSQEDFSSMATGLQQKLSGAADGADETFRHLNLNARQLIGLPLEQQLTTVGEALDRVSLAGDRARFAAELLGGKGTQALRLFGDGSAELKRLMGEAAESGAVLSSEQVQQAQQIDRAFGRVATAVKSAFLEVGRALLPQADTIDGVASAITNAARGVREFIAENKTVILTVAGVGAGLVAAGGVLVGLGVAITGATAAVTGLVTVFGLIKAAVLAVFSPIGLVAAAVAGLGYLFVAHTETGQQLAAELGGGLSDAFTFLKETALQSWGGIVSALKRGDLAAAGEIALAGLNVVWTKVIGVLGSAWRSFTTAIRTAFIDAVAGIIGAASKLAAKLGAENLAGKLSRIAAVGDRAKRQVERDRDAADNAALDAANAARERLAELLKAEAVKAAGPARAGIPGGSGGSRSPLPDFESVVRQVKGGFLGGANAAQTFGIGDTVAQRQLQLSKEQLAELKRINKTIKDKDGPAFA